MGANQISKSRRFAFISTTKTTTKPIPGATEEEWIIGSGASNHMTWRKDFLRDFQKVSNDFVELADKSTVPIEGVGKLEIPIINKKGECSTATFSDVQYVPQLKKNILSVPMMTSKKGVKLTFEHDQVEIFSKSINNAVAHLIEGNLYKLVTQQPKKAYAVAQSTWHRRMGHVKQKLLNIQKNRRTDAVKGQHRVSVQNLARHQSSQS